ncbi:glycine-rich domain-containing protein [Lysinibacillus capsici]|uniref:glycine-rich domain-containing protein n=1 Tax=Lysinibacillus capsici TaxID=2115968 RepID=UPI0036A63B8A
MNIIDLATKTMQTAIKAVVDGIKTTTDATKTGVDSLNTKQDTVLEKIQNGELKRNVAIFDQPGTYTWTCPEGVEAIKLTMFAGGGSGAIILTGGGNYSLGGGGGSYVDNRYIKVVPGTSYQLIVGPGGASISYNSGGYGLEGKTGGASSAFGLVCNGGLGGYQASNPYTYIPPAYGNSPLCSRGSVNTTNGTSTSIADMYTLANTKYGQGGSSTSQVSGGGAGFGDGGNGGETLQQNTKPIGYGAGSGGVVTNASVPISTRKGGDGIIIIEY